jgi:hypothetical protein
MLNTKRAVANYTALERWQERGYEWNKVVTLDNGVLFGLGEIIGIAKYGDYRAKSGEISRPALCRVLGMGLLEFRLFREDWHTFGDFPKPSRVRQPWTYTDHRTGKHHKGHEIPFWDIEEVLEWADRHQPPK